MLIVTSKRTIIYKRRLYFWFGPWIVFAYFKIDGSWGQYGNNGLFERASSVGRAWCKTVIEIGENGGGT